MTFSVPVASETVSLSKPNFFNLLISNLAPSVSSKAITGILTCPVVLIHSWALNKFYQWAGTPEYLLALNIVLFDWLQSRWVRELVVVIVPSFYQPQATLS